MAVVHKSLFIGADGTNILTGYTPEVGTWSRSVYLGGSDPDNYLIHNNQGALDRATTQAILYTNDLGGGEFDVTFPLYIGDVSHGEITLISCRFDPTIADSGFGNNNGYIFQFDKTGVHLFKYDGVSNADLGGASWAGGDLAGGSKTIIVIKMRNGRKSVEIALAEQFAITSDTLPTTSTNQHVGWGGRGFISGIADSGYQLDSIQVDTPTTPLVDPGIVIVNGTLAGFDSGTTSIAPTAVAVECPTPTSGTPGYLFEWHISTTTGFTPSGGTAVSGGTNQDQLITGLTPGTTYYVKCVITDSAPSSLTTSQVSFTTPAAYTAGIAIFAYVGDSTGNSVADGMVTALNAALGRSDTLAIKCSITGLNSGDFTSGNTNKNLKRACQMLKAHTQTYAGALFYGLGLNDAEVNSLATLSANVDDTLGFTASQSLKTVLTYVWFNNTAGAPGIAINATIDSFNSYFEGKGNGITIFIADRQAKNFISHHTDQMLDAKHLNGTGYTSVGKLRGRAFGWRMGLITPTLSASPSTLTPGSSGNSVTVDCVNTGLDGGTPGHPAFTASAGSITAQTLPDFDGNATLTITAPATGEMKITDPDSGAFVYINLPPRVTTVTLVSQQPILSIHLKAPRIFTANLQSQQPTLAIQLKAPRVIHMSCVSGLATIHIRGKTGTGVSTGAAYLDITGFYKGYNSTING